MGTVPIWPPLILAPMASYTHAAFRSLVASYGGCGLFYTEMLNSRQVASGNLALDPYVMLGYGDRPLVAQLVGGEPEIVARALRRLRSQGVFAAFDLNMSCARGAIQRFGWGVSLMKDPDRAREVLAAAVEAAEGLPVTVKIRSGWQHDLDRLLSFVECLEGAGAAGFVLHPRSAREGFRRRARWEEIRAVVEATSVPVIGSGDVFSPEEALRMFAETGCSGVMIGRAALLRPWIFRDTACFLTEGGFPQPPSAFEPLGRLAHLMEELLPESLRLKRFRLYCFWYLQNFAFGLHYFRLLQEEPSLSAMLARLKDLLAREKFSGYPARPFLLR
ncbi:tRNA dihydrouridine synthase [Thermosulfuriphilus sp.]